MSAWYIPNFFNFGRNNNKNSHTTGDGRGWGWGWSIFGGVAQFNNYNNEIEKLEKVLSSPAALKVIAMLCDLYSLGKIYVYKDGKEVEDAKELELFDQPNPFQSQAQWKWTYMFWNLLGNANLYIDKDSPTSDNKLYWLVPFKIEWPNWFDKNKDKLIFSSSSLKEMQDQKLIYKYEDGTYTTLPFKKIIQYFDLSNGIGNWFTGNSRLDALCKIIDISEMALNSKMLNVKFSGQWFIAGASKEGDVNRRMLTPEEKVDIEDKTLTDKPVRAIKNMVELHRFVSDMAALELDPAYTQCVLQIADMWNVPKDVIALVISGSTFENQEKARGAVVSYCLEPKSEDLFGPINLRVFSNRKKKYVQSWDHLPFMQYAEKDKAAVQLQRSVTIRNLQQAGVSTDEINTYLDTNFENLTTSSNGQQQGQQGQQGSQGGNQGMQNQGDAGQGQAVDTGQAAGA